MLNFQEVIKQKKKKIISKKITTHSTEDNEILEKQRFESIYRNYKSKFYIPKRFRGKTFDNYKPYSENIKAFNMVKKYAETFSERNQEGDWLVLSGGYGLGKTHLALATAEKCIEFYARDYCEQYPDRINRLDIGCPIKFYTATELVEEIRDCYDNDMKNEQIIMNGFKTVKLLIIDDLGTEKCSEWQHEKMYSILDYRYREMLTTIITTNLNFVELKKQISERVVERMIEAAGEYLWKFEGKSYRRVKHGNSN